MSIVLPVDLCLVSSQSRVAMSNLEVFTELGPCDQSDGLTLALLWVSDPMASGSHDPTRLRKRKELV